MKDGIVPVSWLYLSDLLGKRIKINFMNPISFVKSINCFYNSSKWLANGPSWVGIVPVSWLNERSLLLILIFFFFFFGNFLSKSDSNLKFKIYSVFKKVKPPSWVGMTPCNWFQLKSLYFFFWNEFVIRIKIHQKIRIYKKYK